MTSRDVPRAWHRIGAALTLTAVLAAGCGGGDDDAGAAEEAAAETTTTTTDAPTTTVAPPTPEPQELGSGPDLGISDPWFTDALGTRIDGSGSGDWSVYALLDGHLGLSAANAGHDLVVFRPNALGDPITPLVSGAEHPLWEIDDLDGWIAALPPEFTVTPVASTSVSGQPVRVLDVVMPPDSCTSSDCVEFLTNGATKVGLDGYNARRVWWIDQGDEDPIVVTARDLLGDVDFSPVDELLATFTLGEPAPNPIPLGTPYWELGADGDVPAGPISVPAASGIELTMPYTTYATHARDLLELWTSRGHVQVLLAAQTDTGDPIASIDDAIDALASAGLALTEIDPATSDHSITWRLFDGELAAQPSSDSRPKPIHTPEDVPWFLDVTVRIWLTDTERGVLMISAGKRDFDTPPLDDPYYLEEAIDLGAEVARTLELDDR